MKIQLMSDVHLEVEPGFVPVPAPDADVLVLAGDIGAGPNTPMAPHGDPEFCLRRFSPALGHWPVPVLYLPVPESITTSVFDFTNTASLAHSARTDSYAALMRFAEHEGPGPVPAGLYGEPPDSVLNAEVSALRCS